MRANSQRYSMKYGFTGRDAFRAATEVMYTSGFFLFLQQRILAVNINII